MQEQFTSSQSVRQSVVRWFGGVRVVAAPVSVTTALIKTARLLLPLRHFLSKLSSRAEPVERNVAYTTPCLELKQRTQNLCRYLRPKSTNLQNSFARRSRVCVAGWCGQSTFSK